MTTYPVFDRITLNSGKEYYGIVDYVSKKHIYFFDFSMAEDPDLTLLALLWRFTHSTKRFSIYATTHFPQFHLPSANLIHRNNIRDSTANLEVTPKIKQRRQSVRPHSKNA